MKISPGTTSEVAPSTPRAEASVRDRSAWVGAFEWITIGFVLLASRTLCQIIWPGVSPIINALGGLAISVAWILIAKKAGIIRKSSFTAGEAFNLWRFTAEASGFAVFWTLNSIAGEQRVEFSQVLWGCVYGLILAVCIFGFRNAETVSRRPSVKDSNSSSY
jgi:hypothetical protein